MKRTFFVDNAHACLAMLCLLAAVAVPELAFAQATSPFETGANNLVTSITTIATPIAVLLVMALGIAAAAGRIDRGATVCRRSRAAISVSSKTRQSAGATPSLSAARRNASGSGLAFM